MSRNRLLQLLAILFLLIAALAGWVLLQSFSQRDDEVVEAKPVGIAGDLVDVSALPLSVALQEGKNKKIAIEFGDDVNGISQIESYQTNYPGYNFDDVAMVLGTVLEVSRPDRLIRLQTDDGEGWVRVADIWHGNTLRLNAAGQYQEDMVLNVARGMWPVMADQLESAKRVMLLCAESSCAEIIGGHIYLD